jgi:hypothetical protein
MPRLHTEERASQAEMLQSAIAIFRTDEASVQQPALEYSSGQRLLRVARAAGARTGAAHPAEGQRAATT